jgi:hypothetical protein
MNSNVERFAAEKLHVCVMSSAACKVGRFCWLLLLLLTWLVFFIMQSTIALCAYSHARYRVCTLTYSHFYGQPTFKCPSSCTCIKFTLLTVAGVALQRSKTFMVRSFIRIPLHFLIVSMHELELSAF